MAIELGLLMQEFPADCAQGRCHLSSKNPACLLASKMPESSKTGLFRVEIKLQKCRSKGFGEAPLDGGMMVDCRFALIIKQGKSVCNTFAGYLPIFFSIIPAGFSAVCGDLPCSRNLADYVSMSFLGFPKTAESYDPSDAFE